jgi:hypothetical protein
VSSRKPPADGADCLLSHSRVSVPRRARKPFDRVRVYRAIRLPVQTGARAARVTREALSPCATESLEVLFEKSGIRASYGTWPSRVTQQPRASGWVGLANGDYHDRERLGMEVWYNDQRLPNPTSVQRQVIPNSSPRLETWFFDWKSPE